MRISNPGHWQHHIDHRQLKTCAVIQDLPNLSNRVSMNNPGTLCHGHFRGRCQLSIQTADAQ